MELWQAAFLNSVFFIKKSGWLKPKCPLPQLFCSVVVPISVGCSWKLWVERWQMPNIRTVAALSLRAEPSFHKNEVNVLLCPQEWWNWGIWEGPVHCREHWCSICGAPGLQDFFGDCKTQAKDCKIWVKARKGWLVATSRKLQVSAKQDTTYLKERWSILSENAGSRDRGANPCCQFFPFRRQEKIFCLPISWLLHSW